MISLKGEINVEGTVSKVGFIKEADVGKPKCYLFEAPWSSL